MHHLLLDRHEPAIVNRVQHFVVERDRLKHLPKRLLIGAVRRRRHAENLQRRIRAVVINHAPVTRRRCMVRLVNDEHTEALRVELGHAPAAVAAGALRLDRRDHHARLPEQTAFGAVFAHLHIGAQAGDALDFVARLEDQFLAMCHHQCALGKHPTDDIGEQHRLAATGRHHDQRGVMLLPFGEDGIRRGRLIRAQNHAILRSWKSQTCSLVPSAAVRQSS